MSGVEEPADDIALRAAEWVARLDGAPLSADETAALRTWLDEDLEHRAAFDEASSTWRELGLLRHEPGPLRNLLPARRRRSTAQRMARIGAVLAVVLLAGGAARFLFGDPWLLARADYRTMPGELRDVTLADGSRIELGPSSAIAIDFDASERRVRFLAGAAFFSAAPRGQSEPRPFVVEAAGGRTTALGTQFAVEAAGAGADILAIEHRIEVAPSTQNQLSVVLSPGQQVRYRPGTGLEQVHTRDIEAATAWRRGLLVFNGAPLSEVVETLNRYRRGRIVIFGAALAQRRVSGVFATQDLSDAIATITSELGIDSKSIFNVITVLY